LNKVEVLAEFPAKNQRAEAHDHYDTPLIPIKNSLNGPLTTSRQLRLYYGYFCLFIIGSGLLLTSPSHFWQTLGAGLIVPGGGFVAILTAGEFWMMMSHAALLIGTLLAFFFALLAWILTGNILAPIAVWLGSAVFAAAMGHHQVWTGANFLLPGIPVLLSVLWISYRRKALFTSIKLRQKRNVYLAKSEGGKPSPMGEDGLPVVDELTAEDLMLMRFLLDRGLQPVDELNGFDILDQFQTASLRYQIANVSYALSLAQYCRTPAFRGYLSQAQVNLIEKMKLPIVWRYWRLENAWGNLRLDGDPMAPNTDDNIMYPGWYAGMIGMYQSNTGDRRYNEPDSLTLTTPKGRSYQYDYPTIVSNICKSHARNAFTLIPCEPNFIYPMCNNYGAMAIKIEDRLNSSSHWNDIAKDFAEKLDSEFTHADGRIDIVRSSRIGFAPPVVGQGPEMYTALFMHAVTPGIARRCWEITRQELLAADSFDDALEKLDGYDLGNYKKSNVSFAHLAAGATEMGDCELAEQLLSEYSRHNPGEVNDGVLHRKSASTMIHAVECAARVNRVNGIKDCVEKGMPEAWLTGPILQQATYPELLVAKAVSDGVNLDIVFYPGQESGGFEITLAQLKPNRHYQCQGAASEKIIGNSDGQATFRVVVDGRSPLQVLAI